MVEFKLYVVQSSPRTAVIVDQLIEILKDEFNDQYALEVFDVFENMEVSLGIAYLTPDGDWSIATRGSFDSPQALKAQEFLKGYPIDCMDS